jgi:hypothetical protein
MLLAVAGTFCAKPAMAQARPTLIQNTDAPARAPFQTTVSLNFSTSTLFVSVPIPSGKRLVVDYVSVNGAASSNSGPIQPVIILESSVAGSPSVSYYLTQTQSPLVTTQFHSEGPMTIYSDTLAVAFGFSGFTPSFAVFNVSISGHLISIVAP